MASYLVTIKNTFTNHSKKFQLSIISNIYLVDHFSIGHVPCSGSVGPSGGSVGHSGESVGSSGGSVGPSCVSLGLLH